MALALLGACKFSGAPSSGSPADEFDGSPRGSDAALGSDAGATAICGTTTPAADELVICYEFEGSFENSVSADLDGAASGTPVFATGQAGRSLSLDGSAYVSTVDNAIFDDFEITVDIWVNPRVHPQEDEERAGLFDMEGNLGGFLRDEGEGQCSGEYGNMRGGTIPIGQWTHFACRQSAAGGTELFINGDRIGCAQNRPPSPSANDPLFVGANSPDGSDAFSGSIDTLRFHTRLLSNQELCEAAGRSNCQVSADPCETETDE